MKKRHNHAGLTRLGHPGGDLFHARLAQGGLFDWIKQTFRVLRFGTAALMT